MKKQSFMEKEEAKIKKLSLILPIVIWIIAIGSLIIYVINGNETWLIEGIRWLPVTNRFMFWSTLIAAIVVTVRATSSWKDIIEVKSEESFDTKEVKKKINEEVLQIKSQSYYRIEWHLAQGEFGHGKRRPEEVVRAILLVSYLIVIDRKHIMVFPINEIKQIEMFGNESIPDHQNIDNTICYQITTENEEYKIEVLHTSLGYARSKVKELNSHLESLR